MAVVLDPFIGCGNGGIGQEYIMDILGGLDATTLENREADL